MPTSALHTDLYQLTMIAGYDASDLDCQATFELYVRRLPPNRAFLVAAGLEQALDYLENLRFTPEQIAFLRAVPNLRGVPASFFDDTLPNFRFTGDVCAVPEGTPVFPLEPLLRVTAPLIQAQLVETALLTHITFQTSIASKAVRIVHAANGRSVMEFGSRRAHGPQAAVYAARAAYIAGCSSTSNVEAGFCFGIPLAGTMAHSWVKSFGDELDAFRTYYDIYGRESTFLIDTYDTLEAARRIVAAGLHPAAVRLDSGDLEVLSREVRRIFDWGGLSDVRILVSGDLDEWSISDLMAREAPIDGFGVGTALSTSKDAPALGGIYKLVEIDRAGSRTPVMKLSGGKASYPGRKQIWRHVENGCAVRDTIAVATEAAPPGARALLQTVMENGRRTGPRPSLDDIRRLHVDEMALLPKGLPRLDPPVQYLASPSAELEALTARTIASITGAHA